MLAHAARSPRASAMLPTRMSLLRPRDGYRLVEGLRLHVLDWGGAAHTPLLLLHGFTGHAHAWDTLSIALQPHVHVYALDARGHGDSDPADTYTAAAAFDDISGVVDQLGLTSCVLVGLSMGGRHAMYFASKRPERVQKLVVVDIGPEVSARATAAVSGPPEPDTWESIEQAAQHLYRANPYPGIHYYRWVVSHSLRTRADGALVWAWHPSVKTRRTQSDVDWWAVLRAITDRKSTRLNSSHGYISYAVFCLTKTTVQFNLSAFLSGTIISHSSSNLARRAIAVRADLFLSDLCSTRATTSRLPSHPCTSRTPF